MLLMIDNYDSFTWNLVQYFEELNQEVLTFYNDAITVAEIEKLNPSYIVISPGPGHPDQSGITMEVIAHFYKNIPILGVCLGHQCIGKFFGGKIEHAQQVVHGKSGYVQHHNKGVFHDLPNPVEVIRYHSLIVSPENLPHCLEVTATDNYYSLNNTPEIMGIKHRSYLIEGVQFHPESIGTTAGHQLLKNFLIAGATVNQEAM